MNFLICEVMSKGIHDEEHIAKVFHLVILCTTTSCDLNNLVFLDRFIMTCFITKATPIIINDFMHVELSYIQTYCEHLDVHIK